MSALALATRALISSFVSFRAWSAKLFRSSACFCKAFSWSERLMNSSFIWVRRSAEAVRVPGQCNTTRAARPEAAASPTIDAGYRGWLTGAGRVLRTDQQAMVGFPHANRGRSELPAGSSSTRQDRSDDPALIGVADRRQVLAPGA